MKEFIDKIANDHAFAEEWGNLGPVYGVQWRKWPDGKGGTIDQIQNAIDMIKTNPESRRNIVSAWNVAEIDDIVQAGGLPPCHTMFQFNVRPGKNSEKDKLDLALTQRSADMFLGVPFNIASYALLLSIVAQVTDKQPGEFIHTLNSAHIYNIIARKLTSNYRAVRCHCRNCGSIQISRILTISRLMIFVWRIMSAIRAIKAPIAV